MKSKHIIAITALTFASLTSCTSVLDKDDLTAVSEKATWNSEILATAFLDKCYKDNLPSFSGDYSKYSDKHVRKALVLLYGSGCPRTSYLHQYLLTEH